MRARVAARSPMSVASLRRRRRPSKSSTSVRVLLASFVAARSTMHGALRWTMEAGKPDGMAPIAMRNPLRMRPGGIRKIHRCCCLQFSVVTAPEYRSVCRLAVRNPFAQRGVTKRATIFLSKLVRVLLHYLSPVIAPFEPTSVPAGIDGRLRRVTVDSKSAACNDVH